MRGLFVLNVAKHGGKTTFQLEIWNGSLPVTKYCCAISYLVHCVCFLGVGLECVCGACVWFSDAFIHSSTWTLGRQQPLRATPLWRFVWQEIRSGGGESNVLAMGTSCWAICIFKLGHWHKFCATFGTERERERASNSWLRRTLCTGYSHLLLNCNGSDAVLLWITHSD